MVSNDRFSGFAILISLCTVELAGKFVPLISVQLRQLGGVGAYT